MPRYIKAHRLLKLVACDVHCFFGEAKKVPNKLSAIIAVERKGSYITFY